MAEEKMDIVGKDLLEQLMFSLYPDAETIYREYLQNKADDPSKSAEGIFLLHELLAQMPDVRRGYRLLVVLTLQYINNDDDGYANQSQQTQRI